MRTTHRFICAVLCAGAPAVVAVAQTDYTVQPISDGSIGVGYWIVGADLNNSSRVCGHASFNELDYNASKPWIADARTNSVQVIIPLVSVSDYYYATVVNDQNDVFGYYLTEPMPVPTRGAVVPFGYDSHAVKWAADGSGNFQSIPGLGTILGEKNLGNIVLGANNTYVVGASYDGVNPSHPTARGFRYNFSTNQLEDLSNLIGNGLRVISVTGINDLNQICGVAVTESSELRGFLADAMGNVTMIPPVFNSPVPGSFENVLPIKLNNLGQVIGTSEVLVPSPEPGVAFDYFTASFLWDAKSGMHSLGDVTVRDINNLGRIVGSMNVETPEGPRGQAFLREPDGTVVDLNALVHLYGCDERNWLRAAHAINDKGEILVIEQWCLDSVFIDARTFVLIPRDCPGDLNYDGNVNVTDLFHLLSLWNTFAPADNVPGDIAGATGPSGPTGDGVINVADLFRLLSLWGECTP